MDTRQIDYFLRREREERDAMALAANEAVADVHRRMAERYAELASEGQSVRQPATSSSFPSRSADNEQHP